MICFVLFCFNGPGAWTQGLHLEPLHQPYFCEGFFKIGSQELFAWAGFEPQSSWSLPPELLGLQAWATGIWQWYGFWAFYLIPSFLVARAKRKIRKFGLIKGSWFLLSVLNSIGNSIIYVISRNTNLCSKGAPWSGCLGSIVDSLCNTGCEILNESLHLLESQLSHL
jgi:hypothetical protein